MDKYEKLTSDLREAFRATEYLEETEDGGTCNFDAPALALPRWNEEKTTAAARSAGGGAFKWNSWGGSLYVIFFPTHCQGNARTRRAEAIADILSDCGYECTMYYQMD